MGIIAEVRVKEFERKGGCHFNFVKVFCTFIRGSVVESSKVFKGEADW